MIPVFRPQIDTKTIKAAVDALDLGWLGMGSYVKEFEAKLAEVLELPSDRCAVAVNTCTSALHLALLSVGVGAGDEVITPALNNIGDFQAIGMCGARPAFADILDDDLGLNPDSVRRLIGPRTKAIIPLHYMGVPCRIDAIYDIARTHGLRVIEDCAHATGTRTTRGVLGSFGDIACFSFDAIKTVTCIDGGAVVLPKEMASALYPLRLLGMTQPNERLYSNARAYDFDVAGQGYRYHLANLHAAIGLTQLAELGTFIENRRRYARLYNEAFGGLRTVRPPRSNFEGASLFHYVVRVGGGRRDEFRQHLRERGVDTGVHWLPGHWFSWLKSCRGVDSLEVTDRAGREIVTLPLWSTMSEDVVSQVVGSVMSFESRGGIQVSSVVTRKFSVLTEAKRHGLRIPVDGFTNAELRAVQTAEPPLRDVEGLTKWRNAHVKSFLTEFVATNERTRDWLMRQLNNDATRILFMIDVDGAPVGYIGLASIDWKNGSAEADSVVRGASGAPGLMSAALRTMVAWARATCGIREFSVRVFADNDAVKFYSRCGFHEAWREPVVSVPTAEGVAWVPVRASTKVERELVHMHLADENPDTGR